MQQAQQRWISRVSMTCLAAASLLVAPPTRAQNCFDNKCGHSDCHAVASGVPEILWGTLRPTDSGILPINRDSTRFNQVGDFETNPYWLSLDVESGADGTWVFALAGRRFQIWDANAPPGNPRLHFDVGLRNLQAQGVRGGEDPHAFVPMKDVDAPPGATDVVAMVGHKGVGVIVWNTAAKESPRVVYQDYGLNNLKEASQVYVTTLANGRPYAFVAASSVDGGFFVYDLAVARDLPTFCQEGQPTQSACPGVYVGKIGTEKASYVDGAGEFVAISGASGLEIWRVSTPAIPTRLMKALHGADGQPREKVQGVALWNNQSGNYYLGLRTQSEARIYDVSCITQGPCSLSTNPLWKMTGLPFSTNTFVTHSQSDGVPFLYFGYDSDCVQGDQKEWLFDVRNPLQPRDIIPQGKALIKDEEVTYPGWYYRRNGIHGFNFFAPRMGKFQGPYFYRAGYSIFDIHQRVAVNPTVTINGPDSGFRDDSIGFSAVAANCDVQPGGWSWQATGGSVSGSGEAVSITWATTGSKTVTATNSGCPLADLEAKIVQIQDPDVMGGNLTVPTAPTDCEDLLFTAGGLTGKPPLTYTWNIHECGGPLVFGPVVLVDGIAPTPSQLEWPFEKGRTGCFEVSALVTNPGDPTGVLLQKTIDVVATPDLPAAGSFTPTHDPPAQTGEVAFHVNVPGAAEYRWDFDEDGDGNILTEFPPWAVDPATAPGPDPVYSYTTTGAKNVRVQVRNGCEAPVISALLPVLINEIVNPLRVDVWSARCPFGFCTFTTEDTITFDLRISGTPSRCEVDWNGNGSFTVFACPPSDANGQLSHRFLTESPGAGYFSLLRLTSGPLTVEQPLAKAIFVIKKQPPPPPPPAAKVTVSGPLTGVVKAVLSYTATASNCTPQPSSWNWNVGAGGTIQGPANGSSISVSYGTAGSRTLRATASGGGCSGTSGIRSVNITGDGGGEGNDLEASFTATPTLVDVGQGVSFNATASKGRPTGFSWDFGDGEVETSGELTSHTYLTQGTFQVTLEVSKEDPSCPFNRCTDETTRIVTVAGPAELSPRIGLDLPCFSVSGNTHCEAEIGQQVVFTDDSEGPVLERTWDFGDGTMSSQSTVTHGWQRAGSFLVTLTVSGGGMTKTAQLTIRVLGAAVTTLSVAPAATLLVPYFAVDTDDQGGLTTLFAVTNTAAEPHRIKVTLWTDWAVASMSFEMLIGANAVETINLRDIFAGRLPSPPPGCQHLGLPVSEADLPPHLQAWHRGQKSPVTLDCASSVRQDSHLAVGYLTIDIVGECSDLDPSKPGYFGDGGAGTALNNNVLLGDYFFVEPNQDFAQGGVAVHVRADAGTHGNGSYTFYGRYTDGADNRQPLGSAYGSRFLTGPPFDGTRLLVWRDTKSASANPVSCSGPGPFPLSQSNVKVFDEHGNTVIQLSGQLFPLATQSVSMGGENGPQPIPTLGTSFGRLEIDLNHSAGNRYGDVAQAYVGVHFSADERYSVDVPAHVLESVSLEAASSGVSSPDPDSSRAAEDNGNPTQLSDAANFVSASSFSASCDLGVTPAATLLVPYFAVDLEDGAGLTTLFAATNTAETPRLAKATVWTDWGIPALSFDVYLSGHDTVTINMRDVLQGTLPQTGPETSARVNPGGTQVNFPDCGFFDLTGPTNYQDRVQAWLTGQSWQGFCAASGQGGSNLAVGYLTFDVVNRCSNLDPTKDGYFGPSGVSSDDNIMIGDFFFVSPRENFAQGAVVAHVLAEPGVFSDGDYTFYGRYVDWSGQDNRQPLGSVYHTRYLAGGGFTGGTQLLVWRDTRDASPDLVPCGQTPEWGPLRNARTSVYTEDGNPTLPAADMPPFGFPWATQLVQVGGEAVPTARPFGRLKLDLNHGKDALGEAAQGYVGVSFRAEGRYSIGAQASTLGRVCGVVQE